MEGGFGHPTLDRAPGINGRKENIHAHTHTHHSVKIVYNAIFINAAQSKYTI